MWGFKQKPAGAALSKKLTLHLAKQCGLSDETAASLRVMEKHGHYAGRKVTYFRVFDPANVEVVGINPRHFSDLDACKMLHSGHIESDGQIVLNK